MCPGYVGPISEELKQPGTNENNWNGLMDEILAALKDADIDTSHVNIYVVGSKVSLRGRIDSTESQHHLMSYIKSVPGVKEVHTHLLVESEDDVERSLSGHQDLRIDPNHMH